MNLWDLVSNVAAICSGVLIVAVTVSIVVSMVKGRKR